MMWWKYLFQVLFQTIIYFIIFTLAFFLIYGIIQVVSYWWVIGFFVLAFLYTLLVVLRS